MHILRVEGDKMPIVGFSFESINVERRGPVQGNISVTNNVVVTNIEKSDLALGGAKQDGLRFSYKFVSKYEPDLGEIVLKGEVLFIDDQEKIKSIAEGWEKSKQIPQDVMGAVLNAVLERCNIEALILSRDVNLPAPIRLPKIDADTPRVRPSEKTEEKQKPEHDSKKAGKK